jgi:hypothetical protein
MKFGIIKGATLKTIYFRLLFIKYDQNWKVAGSIPNELTGFLNWPNPSSRTVAKVSTQPLTKMSTRNLRGGGAVMGDLPVGKADHIANCEPTVYKM